VRTTLDSGAWVEHRPIGDLKRKDKQLLSRLTTGKLMGAGLDLTAFAGADEKTIGAAMMQSGGVNIMGFAAEQEDAILALLITGWSYDLPVPSIAVNEDGTPVIVHDGSLGELPLDDANEIEQVFAPYKAKLSRKPDPKGSTTSSSNGSSPASQPASPTA